MKKLGLIIIVLYFTNGYSQTISELDLIGKWKFIELQDEKGIKQTKIPFPKSKQFSVEIVNRDDYFFDQKGKYKSENPHKKSSGTWFFDSKKKEINLELKISKKDMRFLKYLKQAKIVEKREDGFYYQKAVQKKILFFSKDSMTIKDRDNYYLIYKKIN